MNWKAPIVVLVVLLILVAAGTWLTYKRDRGHAIDVPLGIVEASDPKAKYIDGELTDVYHKGRYSRELRVRLNRPSYLEDLEPFYMDMCEVTQRDYERFLAIMLSHVSTAERENSPLYSHSIGHRLAGRMDSPASGMSLTGASEYCQLIGGRLPTAEEFEAAAKGLGNRLFPWGDQFNHDLWPYKLGDRNAAQSCGSQESSATPQDIFDLANNVMEWSTGLGRRGLTSKPAAHGAPPTIGPRDGLYALNFAWLEIEPHYTSHYLGFRCVYDRVPLINPIAQTIPQVAYVPGGTYQMGLPPQARLPQFLSQLPENQRLNLSNLLLEDKSRFSSVNIQACEVSREDYADFLADPLVRAGFYGNEREPKNTDYTPLSWEEQSRNLDMPVTGMTWWAADAYARWVGGELPSADEWRMVATGSTARLYPWGDYFDENDVGVASRLGACGANDLDQTPDGVFDMGGNISEWTNSVSAERGQLKMWVQGGNWRIHSEETSRSTFGRTVPLAFQSETIGLRVLFN